MYGDFNNAYGWNDTNSKISAGFQERYYNERLCWTTHSLFSRQALATFMTNTKPHSALWLIGYRIWRTSNNTKATHLSRRDSTDAFAGSHCQCTSGWPCETMQVTNMYKSCMPQNNPRQHVNSFPSFCCIWHCWMTGPWSVIIRLSQLLFAFPLPWPAEQ